MNRKNRSPGIGTTGVLVAGFVAGVVFVVSCGKSGNEASAQSASECHCTLDEPVEIVGNVALQEPVIVDGIVDIGNTVDVTIVDQPVSVAVTNTSPANLIDMLVSGAVSQKSQYVSTLVDGGYELETGHVFVTRVVCRLGFGNPQMLRVFPWEGSPYVFTVPGGGGRGTYELTTPYYVDNTAGDKTIFFEFAPCYVTYLLKE